MVRVFAFILAIALTVMTWGLFRHNEPMGGVIASCLAIFCWVVATVPYEYDDET